MSWNTGLARIGAVLYALWGLVHYHAAYGVHQLAQAAPLTIEHGRLEQLAFYLASFATASIVLATLNWRKSPLGFWCNALVIGVGDIPFILFVLVPGYVPVWPGIEGPVSVGRSLGLHRNRSGASVPRSRWGETREVNADHGARYAAARRASIGVLSKLCRILAGISLEFGGELSEPSVRLVIGPEAVFFLRNKFVCPTSAAAQRLPLRLRWQHVPCTPRLLPTCRVAHEATSGHKRDILAVHVLEGHDGGEAR